MRSLLKNSIAIHCSAEAMEFYNRAMMEMSGNKPRSGVETSGGKKQWSKQDEVQER